jgi:hypothetical protein
VQLLFTVPVLLLFAKMDATTATGTSFAALLLAVNVIPHSRSECRDLSSLPYGLRRNALCRSRRLAG